MSTAVEDRRYRYSTNVYTADGLVPPPVSSLKMGLDMAEHEILRCRARRSRSIRKITGRNFDDRTKALLQKVKPKPPVKSC